MHLGIIIVIHTNTFHKALILSILQMYIKLVNLTLIMSHLFNQTLTYV